MSEIKFISEILNIANSRMVSASKLEHLEDLDEKEFLSKTVNLPSKCPQCGASVVSKKEMSDGEVLLECEKYDKELVKKENYEYYEIDFEEVANRLGENLGLSIDSVENKFPNFLFGKTERINLVLMSVIETGESSFLHLFKRIIQEKEPALIITTDKSVEKALDIQSVFSAGNLTYIMPIEELYKNIELAKDRIKHMEKIEALQSEVFEEVVSGSNSEIIADVEINPKHLISYLNHLRLMKETEGKFDWTEMEDLTSAAFSRIFLGEIDEAGGSERGVDIPDNLFVIPKNGDPYISGVVDTKSNYKAKLNQEKSKKHLNYLDRVDESTALSGSKKCLIFVIFDIQGETDLEFYQRVKEELRDDEYVVVLELDALITMLEFYLSLCISNKLKFRELDINDIFGQLFDESNLEMNEKLRDRQVRSVKGSLDQEEFDKKMLQANNLYYIPESFVYDTLEERLEDKSDLEFGFSVVFDN